MTKPKKQRFQLRGFGGFLFVRDTKTKKLHYVGASRLLRGYPKIMKQFKKKKKKRKRR